MVAYGHLFTEGTIGSLRIPNRVIMPAMGTVLCNADGSVSSDQIAYYEERAKGGTGLIITEIVAVENELGRAVAVQTRADEDRYVPGLSRLASAVHKYPTRLFAQLHHAGNQSNSRITGGKQIVAPSVVKSGAVGEEPRALHTGEVKDLVEKFVSAAVRCRTAGFDGVQLHGAHGYLINQFLSPHSNLRDDEYGGSTENRARFATEIIRGIKNACGTAFPVMVRFSADEFLDDGISLEEGKELAKHFERAGADALDVSCGTYETMHTLLEPITYDEGWRVYLAESIKAVVKIPVAAVGVIRHPSFAEEVLSRKRADFVAIGRDLLSDPEWVNKARDGRDKEICQCISCLHCIDTIFASRPIECAVNARAGRERELGEPRVDGNGRKVVVVGGGPGGIEAARVLRQRGFTPVLFEKHSELGGELVPGCRPPNKQPISWYKDYLAEQVRLLGIELRLGTEATPEMVRREKPHAVVVAVGAEPRMPEGVPGASGPNVCSFLDILWERSSIGHGRHAVVIGAGLTGCETAHMLVHHGAKVTLVDMLPEMALGENAINRAGITIKLREAGVGFLPCRKLMAVRDGEVDFERLDDGSVESLKADHVVISIGLRVDEAVVRQWTDSFERVRVIGDVVYPRKVAQAVREAFDAAFVLEGGPVVRAEPQIAAPGTGPRRKGRPRERPDVQERLDR